MIETLKTFKNFSLINLYSYWSLIIWLCYRNGTFIQVYFVFADSFVSQTDIVHIVRTVLFDKLSETNLIGDDPIAINSEFVKLFINDLWFMNNVKILIFFSNTYNLMHYVNLFNVLTHKQHIGDLCYLFK